MSNLAIVAAGRVPGRNACCSVFKDRGDRKRGRPIDPISTFAAPESSEAPSAGAKSAPYAGVSMGGRSKRWCLNRVLSVDGADAPPNSRGSIARPGSQSRFRAGPGPPSDGASEARARRAKRRFPARITRPCRAFASRSSSCTGSPSRLTPPPAIRRRASLREATPSRSARRAGQVHRAVPVQHDRGHLLRRPVVADRAVEVGLGLRSRPVAVEAVGDQAPEAALVLHGGARGGRLGRREEPVPLRKRVVGDPHRAAELLGGRIRHADLVARATCSSSGRRRCPTGSASS